MPSSARSAQVIVRRSTESDLESLVDLSEHVHQLHFRQDDRYFKPFIREDIRTFFTERLNGEELLLLAERPHQAVGYVLAQVRPGTHNPFTAPLGVLFIDQIAVAPTARRMGVGTALMHAATAEARRLELHEVRLDSWTFNEPAHAFFQRHGLSPFKLAFRGEVE